MKKLLLIIAAFTISSASFGQILSQDFESATFPPTGWTIDTMAPTRPWMPTTALTQAGQDIFLINGTNSAFINWIVSANTANLISPSFSLVGYSAATFDFTAVVGYEYMVAPNPNGNLKAKISIDGGTTWADLWVEEDYGIFADYDHLAISLALTPYLGQANVKIKFEYSGTDADSVSVDDILISGTLSTSDFLAGKFSIYPNPAKNLISVINTENINVTGITIADLNGRIVKTVKTSNVSDIEVNISELAAGMYVMNINSDQGIATKKIVKE